MLKSKIFYFIALSFIFFMVYPYIFNSKIFLGGDNANYFSLAKGIASDFTYSSANDPIPSPANHFPPGYPFLLALFIKMGVSTMYGLKIVNGLFLLGISFLTYLISLRLTKQHIFAGLIAVAILLNAHILEYSSIVMSEIPFVFFLLLGLLFFMKFVDSDYKIKSVAFVLTVCASIFLVYLRTQGIAVIGAFLFYLLINKKFKASAILLACFLIAYTPWQIRSANLGGNSYAKQLFSVDPYNADSKKMEMGDWGTRIGHNAVRYVSKEIPGLIHPGFNTVYNDPSTGKPKPASTSQWVVGVLLIIVSLFGIWKLAEIRWLLLSFFGANFLIFMLWPDVWFGIRFILPMTPLILISFFIGLKNLIQLGVKNEFVTTGKVYILLILPFLFLSFKAVKTLHAKSEANHPPNWSNFLSVAEWSNDNLKPSDIVVTRKPGLYYTFSNTKTKTFPYTSDIQVIIDDFSKNKVTHIVFEQLGFSQTGKYLYPLLVKEPDRFNLIYSVGARDATDANGNKTKTKDGVWLYEYTDTLGFQGEYDGAIKNGEGLYKYRNGSTIQGVWVNDTLNGPGIYTQKDGQQQTGTWKNGKRNGTFIITSKDNRRIESEWIDDVVQPMGYVLDANDKRVAPIKLN